MLDRDGTVCKHVPYLSSPDRFELLPTVAEGIQALETAGVPRIVVTNQSGIGRGYFERADAERVNDAMRRALDYAGTSIDDVYLCPHHPADDCDCRKPEPGMLRAAARDHDIALPSSYVVGDRESDIGAGNRVGCTTVLFPSPETDINPGETAADHVVDSFRDAVDIILDGVA